MPLEVGKRALQSALRQTRRRLHLVFFGGEPLLRWADLLALTDEARTRGESCGVQILPTLTTNGTLLTDDRCAELAQRRFLLAVSCDGLEMAHDALRRDRAGMGSFARTWQGINTALKAHLRPRIALVVHPSNIAYLPESIEFFVAAGLRDFVVNLDWSAPWDARGMKERLTHAYENVAALYVQAYRDANPFWISMIDSRIADRIRGVDTQDRCDLGRRNLVVAPSGNLYPCDRLIGEDDGLMSIGHIDSGVDARRLKAFMKQASFIPTACLSCAIRERCRHRCACANLAMSGHAGTPTSLLCFYEQLCLRTADDAAEMLFSERNEGFLGQHYGDKVPF